MNFIKTNFENVIVIEPQVFTDNRGYFFESYREQEFKDNGIDCNFVQENQSMSKYGVIRGLHTQLGEFDQAKIVKVIKGKVLDVIVDIRPYSNTFGQYFSIELSEENKKQLFIPKGFLHGYSVLSENCIFTYKLDGYYNKNAEYGVIYNDIDLNINWKIPKNDVVIVEKDKLLHTFKELKEFLNV